MRIRRRPGLAFAFVGVSIALLAVGTSGAVAALGDTLYPAGSLADALRADLSPTSHVLIRLRVLHPALAIGTALLILVFVPRMPLSEADRRGRRAARAVAVLAAVQIGAGFLNVVLLAPVWIQLVHLLLADALWVAFVLFAISALAEHAQLSAALAQSAA